jgi:hypothetical protein
MRTVLRLLAITGLPIGGVLLGLVWSTPSILLQAIYIITGMALVVLSVVLILGYTRRNQAVIAPDLQIESRVVVDDGWHNSNTDMIYWRDAFYLIHAASPYHFASEKCRLIVRRSKDAKEWEAIADLGVEQEDIRDPKFAIIQDQLYLYALVNRSKDPEPYTTVYATSFDGKNWSPFERIKPEGWLFWRPKSRDGNTWYVPAYWWEHGKSILLRSEDGVNWAIISTIYGRMIATARLEYSSSIFGDRRGATLISISTPDYGEWHTQVKSQVTRLDGPCLFAWNQRVYAVGRYQPEVNGPFLWQGSVFARKRTSLFEVRSEGLVYISDFPSAGDTSYVGVVIRENIGYACYYTSPVQLDYYWIIGMLEPSAIYLTRFDMNSLEAKADKLAAA